MENIIETGAWLPLVFAFLMGLAMLVYAVLDGYDLGVGILFPWAKDDEKDSMVASIGPFWDANETWLVLGVGLLLVAFPMAHGMILSSLYLPVAVMLIGLIFRGVAFEYRAKVPPHKKAGWNNAFCVGSIVTALAQGYMLGSYILGFEQSLAAVAFSLFTGVCVVAAYALIGAAWLIMKAEGNLQRKAIRWAQYALYGSVAGIVLVSVSTPLVSPRIFAKWFSLPEMFYLAPVPLITGVLVLAVWTVLRNLPLSGDRLCWLPFVLVVGVYVLCFNGLAYSFYPYIVPDKLTILDAASAPESLWIILIGALVVLPVQIAYTAFVYVLFHGKSKELRYD